jgi:hypothetical protein
MDDEDSPGVLADDAALVLAARFGSLIANWNGEVDEQFEARARVLNGLCRSVVQLQRGMHRSNRESFELTCKWEEKEKADEEVLKKELVKPCYDMLKLPVMAKMFGGGAAGRKIAEYILAVRRGNLNADLDLLPTDNYGDEKVPAKAPESVKPTRKERTVKQARKTTAKRVDKPLQESEISSPRRSRCGEGGSNPVKVNQSDLAPSNEASVASFPNPNPNPNPNLNLNLNLPTPEENSTATALQQLMEAAEKGDAYVETVAKNFSL